MDNTNINTGEREKMQAGRNDPHAIPVKSAQFFVPVGGFSSRDYLQGKLRSLKLREARRENTCYSASIQDHWQHESIVVLKVHLFFRSSKRRVGNGWHQQLHGRETFGPGSAAKGGPSSCELRSQHIWSWTLF